jgi:fatty-acyl-CoA synthase
VNANTRPGLRNRQEVLVQRESYLHGNSGRPLIGKTIGTLLGEVKAIDGSHEAPVVAHQNIRSTYSELEALRLQRR